MGWLGRVVFVLCLAGGLVAWKTGRLGPQEANPVLQKVNDAIGESAAKTRVEAKKGGVIVHLTLMTQAQRYRASDMATQACAAAAGALEGQKSVTVMVEGPPDRYGYAPLYGSASYSSLTRRMDWQSHQ